MDQEKSVQQLLDRARDIGSRTTTVSLVVFITLFLSWISELSPRIPDLRNAVVRGTAARELAGRYLALEARRRQTIQFFTAKLEAQRDPKLKSDLESERKALEDNFHKSIQQNRLKYQALYRIRKLSYDSQRRLVENVKFKVLDVELPVSGPWAPALWLSILALGLTNLACSRAAILGMYSKALRICSSEPGTDKKFWCEAVGDAPVWIAPVSLKIEGDEEQVKAFRAAVRFSFETQWLSYAAVLGALNCVILQVPVSFMGLAYGDLTVKSDQITTAVTRHWWLIVLVFCSAAVTVLLGLWWLCPLLPSSTQWLSDSRPLRAIGRWISRKRQPISSGKQRSLAQGRRALLASLVATLTSATLIAMYDRRRSRFFNFNPRFKKRKPQKPPKLRPGFYRDRETRLIHYAGETGFARSLRRIPPSRLDTLPRESLSAEQLPWVHPSALTPWIRRVTQKLVRERHHVDACKLLVSAIEMNRGNRKPLPYDRVSGGQVLGEIKSSSAWTRVNRRASKAAHRQRMPNFALYDLLAIVAVRYSQPEYRCSAIELLEAERFERQEKQTLAASLQERVAKEDVDLLKALASARSRRREKEWRLTKHKVDELTGQLSRQRISGQETAAIASRRDEELKLLAVIAATEPKFGHRASARQRFVSAVRSRLDGLKNIDWKPDKIRIRA